jgi:hypothetical protein
MTIPYCDLAMPGDEQVEPESREDQDVSEDTEED